MFDFLQKAKPRRMRIVRHGHPALRKRSEPVTAITPELVALAERMIVTMQENEVVGVGLAAPQVGVNIRLIVIDTRSEKDDSDPAVLSPGEALLNPRMPLALVNPEIVSSSAETECAGEGCLSVPDVSGEVTRPARVILRAKSLAGEELQVECGHLLSRCLQHEIDHLDGVLFIDRISAEEQKIAAPTLARMEKAEQRRLASRQR
ncbi:peptide deformylase [Oligosphaera ethanolica]|uniref:Peptide deformylase n=1 Tax=Oligosphaera ethanolica TaxID=760260 RepID=A0AAE3VIK7_9BACT|nr:peptide deformylase [Oligosphaera ethanolica]MDQ0290946.1 peptide deformylase [Oligosphaera ethanolica]NLE55925.1 peptide deformylase [Lentisphaerota bacterium]